MGETQAAACVALLAPVRAIAASYRMTGKQLPSQPSFFISGILAPLRDFLTAAKPRLSPIERTEWAVSVCARLTEQYHALAAATLDTVRHAEAAPQWRLPWPRPTRHRLQRHLHPRHHRHPSPRHELAASSPQARHELATSRLCPTVIWPQVRKNEEALQRLNLKKQGGAATPGPSPAVEPVNAEPVNTAEPVSDSGKICMQMCLDVQAYGEELHAVGVAAGSIEAYLRLQDAVRPDEQLLKAAGAAGVTGAASCPHGGSTSRASATGGDIAAATGGNAADGAIPTAAVGSAVAPED